MKLPKRLRGGIPEHRYFCRCVRCTDRRRYGPWPSPMTRLPQPGQPTMNLLEGSVTNFFLKTGLRFCVLIDFETGRSQVFGGEFPDRVREISQIVGDERLLVESTGLGLAIAEDLAAKGVNVQKVRILS